MNCPHCDRLVAAMVPMIVAVDSHGVAEARPDPCYLSRLIHYLALRFQPP